MMALLTLAMAAGVPSVMAVNPGPQQNLFEADFGTGSINEFMPGGVQSTFVSGLSLPKPLAIDGSGNLYVGNNGVITKITPGGMPSTFASGLNPQGLAFNSAGNLFVANRSDTIIEITPEGVQSTFVSGIGGLAANLAFDSSGNLFVTSLLSSAIFEVTPGGTLSTFTTGVRGPLAFDSKGDLFVAFNLNIFEYINNGGSLSTTQVLFAPVSSTIEAMAFDNAGDLFDSDLAGNSIDEFVNNGGTLSSTPTIFASGLNQPFGLAFAPIPEPSSLALLATGSVALLIRRRKN